MTKMFWGDPFDNDDDATEANSIVNLTTKEYRKMIKAVYEYKDAMNTNYSECTALEKRVKELEETVARYKESLDGIRAFIGSDADITVKYQMYIIEKTRREQEE